MGFIDINRNPQTDDVHDECHRCGNNAIPCGCYKTPAMEKEVDIAIRDYRAKRFDPYLYYKQGKLCIWNADDGPLLARWDRENGRAIRAILPEAEQEFYQALLKQRLNALNLTLS